MTRELSRHIAFSLAWLGLDIVPCAQQVSLILGEITHVTLWLKWIWLLFAVPLSHTASS